MRIPCSRRTCCSSLNHVWPSYPRHPSTRQVTPRWIGSSAQYVAMARRLGQGCGSWNACGGEAGRKALQSTRASASAERAPVGEKAPEGERAAEAESAAEAERAPEGETAPEGERAPEGEKDMARLRGKKAMLKCCRVTTSNARAMSRSVLVVRALLCKCLRQVRCQGQTQWKVHDANRTHPQHREYHDDIRKPTHLHVFVLGN